MFYAFYGIYIFNVIYPYQHFLYRYINISPNIDIIDIFWYFFITNVGREGWFFFLIKSPPKFYSESDILQGLSE